MTFDTRRQRKRFFPINSLERKSNFKPYIRIERDGSLMEGVFLNVPDPRLREEIIQTHFLRTYVKWVIQDDIGFNIVGRDDPWDFRLEVSNGDHFNIEIVSIAEDKQLFINNKREETLEQISQLETISLSRLRKINRNIPDEKVGILIKELDAAGHGKNEKIKNPWYDGNKRILISSVPAKDLSLSELIDKAISGKTSKAHPDKNKTILIIDNRTSKFEVDSLFEAAEKFDVSKIPFREIWFYTGFYSDNSGDNAEWSLAPIHAPKKTLKRIQNVLAPNDHAPNSDRIFFDTM